MKDQETKEKILYRLTVVTLCCAGIFGYEFFKNPDSVFGLLFVLSGMVLGVITNLWCAVWGIEISEDEEYMYFDDYEPHKDIGVDPLNIYGVVFRIKPVLINRLKPLPKVVVQKKVIP